MDGDADPGGVVPDPDPTLEQNRIRIQPFDKQPGSVYYSRVIFGYLDRIWIQHFSNCESDPSVRIRIRPEHPYPDPTRTPGSATLTVESDHK